jgi:hypothetical protein
MRKILLFIIPFLFCTEVGLAQRSLEVGLFGGGAYYLGDLNPQKHFSQIDLAYGLMARYNLDSRWAVKVGAYRGTVKADDNISKANLSRQLSFSSKITEISAVMELNFLDYITGNTRQYISPYIFAGIGFFFHNPKVGDIKLKDMGTEGQNIGYDGREPYNLFSFALPFGFGFKYSLNKKLGFALEWGIRKTLTDYIDDVSETYYLDGESIDPNNTAQVLSDPTMDHIPGMQRGDPQTKDWYSFVGITVTYKFNLFRQYRCTDFGVRRKY